MIQDNQTDNATPLSLRRVNPPALFDPVPYGFSHVVEAGPIKKIAFIAGQGGENSDEVLAEGFEKQVEQAYKNLTAALGAIGASPQMVIKITTYVVDYQPTMLEVMTYWVNTTFAKALPAQTLVPVPRLALDGMLFEVEAIVALA